jgi:DNA-binding transcriptional LysR family regulator
MIESKIQADRLELMQTFIRIVEAGSLSAAAAQLGTTQPTVSRRLKALELLLGLRLLQRSTHSMTLTVDGERLLDMARELVAGWEALQSELTEGRDKTRGKLRVVAPHALGQDQLMSPLVDYLRRYPDVAVEWRLNDRLPDFAAEDVDCAIHVGAVNDPSVVALLMAEVPRIVVAAPELITRQPLTEPDDLTALPWLALSTFYHRNVALQRMSDGEEKAFAITPRLATDSLYALRRAALDGLGVAIVSAWLVVDDISTGRLVHLVPEWRAAPLPTYLVYPASRLQPRRLRTFIDAMRDSMPHGAAGPQRF